MAISGLEYLAENPLSKVSNKKDLSDEGQIRRAIGLAAISGDIDFLKTAQKLGYLKSDEDPEKMVALLKNPGRVGAALSALYGGLLPLPQGTQEAAKEAHPTWALGGQIAQDIALYPAFRGAARSLPILGNPRFLRETIAALGAKKLFDLESGKSLKPEWWDLSLIHI